jgi:alcohol oxidase
MADASLTILLVEAGRNNYADPTITNPAVFLAHLRPDSKTVTFHKGRRTQALANREPIVPAGNILGGVSLCTSHGCWPC